MNIYFTAAISLKHKYGKYYEAIVKHLLSLGHKVQYEHIINVSLSDIIQVTEKEQRVEYYNKVNKWISKADIVVAELSFPSTLNIGHEVTIALQKNKPVIGLFSKGNDSLFFQGINNEKFLYQNYTEKNLVNVLKEGIEYCSENEDIRFNMMLTSKLSTFLDEVIKQENTTKAAYIRQLILNDKKQRNAE